MAAPTNITALLATDLGSSYPASATQTVDDAGTTYSVWFKTTPSTTGEIGVWGFGDLSVYTPRAQAYIGPAAAPVAYLVDTGTTNANKPFQLPVTGGTTYYFKFTPNAGNPTPAVLHVSVQAFTNLTAPAGSIAVNDDTGGFPLVLLEEATGDVLRFVSPFPNGESGDVLDNGIVLVQDATNNRCALYAADYTTVLSLPALVVAGNGGCIRTNQATQRFWVAYTSGATRLARYVEDDGTLGTAHTLTAIANIYCCASNNAESVLYHVASGSNVPIRQWDLLTDTAGANLVAGVASYFISDILVLSDHSILASYIKTSATVDVLVKRFNAAGTLLSTYSFGALNAFPSGTLPRIAYAADDPDSFWIWRHPSAGNLGLSVFENVDVATGAILSTRTVVEYESGVYNRPATATPEADFGISFSCPFWITREAVGQTSGTIEVIKVTSPSGDPQSFDFTAGGGLSPTTFSLSDGGTRTFSSVPVGSGYSVAEAPIEGWTTSVVVSNGSPIDNLSVSDGETVTVTFTNAAVTFPSWLDSRVVRYPRRLMRTPHLSDTGQNIRLKLVQLDIQAGMADPADPNAPRDLIFRKSDDGGHTWSNERVQTVGALGEYQHRARWWQCGTARDSVLEITDSLPNPFIQMWVDVSPMEH